MVRVWIGAACDTVGIISIATGNTTPWKGTAGERDTVYVDRRRGEVLERSFAQCYATGGMRRTHLRHQDNILKRLLIHTGAFNLSLVFRNEIGTGTPRNWGRGRKMICQR